MKIIKAACAVLVLSMLVASCATAKPSGADVSAGATEQAVSTEQAAVKTKATATGTKNSAAKKGSILLDGFEASSTWIAVAKNWGDGDCSKSVAVSDTWASEGKSSLEVTFNPLVKDKGATCFNEMLDVTDYSAYEAIVMDVDNPTGQPMQVAVAVSTGDSWDWFETNVVELPAGETRDIRFDLYTGALKSAGTNWQFSTDLKNPDDVRRFAVKFFGAEGLTGSVFIDNVRLSN